MRVLHDYIFQAIGQFWKRLDSIVAVNGGRVKPLNIAFNTTTLQCSDQGQSIARST